MVMQIPVGNEWGSLEGPFVPGMMIRHTEIKSCVIRLILLACLGSFLWKCKPSLYTWIEFNPNFVGWILSEMAASSGKKKQKS